MDQFLLAIDQGTTGTTALLMSADGKIFARSTREFAQHFPTPGWVEHDPEEIWQSVRDATAEALSSAGIRGSSVAAVGITNQRETTLAWDRANGRCLHRAIVWQDRRTAPECAQLASGGHEPRVSEVTGLLLDPYFSGTKARWLLDNAPSVAEAGRASRLAFGTVDSFLIWRLTQDERGVGKHATDVTNASRTLLMDLRTLEWSAEMCALFGVDAATLPTILPSAGHFGRVRGFDLLPDGVPITGVAGDQQAALFGQGCFEPGDIKCTYGTGAFLMLNTGTEPVRSQHRLLTTIAWSVGGVTSYALEGSSFIAGAAVGWLRDALGIIQRAADVEALARQVPSSEGVTFVLALAGLGAPYWDSEARGLITGLTRGSTKAHIARATLDAIACSVNDLLLAMSQDLGAPIRRMRVDGGAAANDFLMQIQSDIADMTIERPSELEATARGAAMLAAVGAGIFSNLANAAQMVRVQSRFEPQIPRAARDRERERWREAVQLARTRKA